MNNVLQLKKGRPARVLNGHPWVFSTEVEALLDPSFNGQAVELKDSRGRSLGAGLYNGQSTIVWRRFSRKVENLDASLLGDLLEKAVRRRTDDPYQRLVWSEADLLPGLVVDRFGSVLVVQALTLGMEQRLPWITDWLRERYAPQEIVLRNDAPTRLREGMECYARTLSGQPLSGEWHRIDGLEYYLDFLGGQKTGYYMDQREQHLLVSTYAEGRRVLDAFCNQGAFALHAAARGASSVLGLDISGDCVQAASRNAERNGLTVDFQEANVFDWMTEHREGQFDLIVLDPPSFARNRKSLAGAIRGYKELHLRALRMLSPGGILATYSCSQHVDSSLFLQSLSDAAADVRREVRLLHQTGQPADHPVVITIPESHYLKGYVVQAD